MQRILLILFGVLVVLFAGGALLFFLSYGLERDVPAEVRIESLRSGARLEWQPGGAFSIRADGEFDAYAALGYAHGVRHGWTAALWRQTATGRLTEWFGEGLLVLDSLALRLGLAELSRQAYAHLPEEEQLLLQAYAAGMSSALLRQGGRHRQEFILTGVSPGAWEPWHALAIERLIAWLATPSVSPDSAAVWGPDAESFFRSDRLLRQWLHLHGFSAGTAWAVHDSAGVLFFQRHVYGASALPIFQEVTLQWGDAAPITAASLIGTPFLPGGRDATSAWSVLMSGAYTLRRAPVDTSAVGMTYRRLIGEDGTEHLLTIRRTEGALFFRGATPPLPVAAVPDTVSALLPPLVAAAGVDTLWALEWPGLRPVTDWPAWRRVAAGGSGDFALISGSGLRVGRGGSIEVMGRPLMVRRIGNGVLVSNTPWAEFAAERIDSLVRFRNVGAEETLQDSYSTWASRLAPPLISSVVSVPDQPPAVAEAITFLRNWDFQYSQSSIAAAVFDSWMAEYRDSLGALPSRAIADTSAIEHLQRYAMLVRAVDRLAAAHGPNLSQWRWERVQPKRYYFPVWSADTLLATRARVLPHTRYAPVDMPGSGHPSVVRWGPSIIHDEPPSPAYWEGWLHTGSWEPFIARWRRLDTNRFFGRYLIMDRPAEAVAIDAAEAGGRVTRLVPADRPAPQRAENDVEAAQESADDE